MIEVGSYCCSCGGEPLALVEDDRLLVCGALLRFFGFGIGVMNSARRRVSMICCVGWPVLIELPVAPGVLVGGVEDRVVEEGVVQGVS